MFEKKKMTKDEMKDKISFALKDPILQQGFEIICKENAELRNIAEFQQSSNMNRYFENKKLKDENTRLKEKLNTRSYQNCKRYNRSCPNDGSCVNYSKWEIYINPELTKAKEIIKKFLEFVNNEVEFDPEHSQEHTDLWNELCEKAEQFISEVEE